MSTSTERMRRDAQVTLKLGALSDDELLDELALRCEDEDFASKAEGIAMAATWEHYRRRRG